MLKLRASPAPGALRRPSSAGEPGAAHADAPGEPPSNGDLGPDPGHSGPGHPAEPDVAAPTIESGATAAATGGEEEGQNAEESEPRPEGGDAAHDSSGERRESGTEAGMSQEAAGEPEGGAAGAAEPGYGAPAGLPHVQGGTPGRSKGGDEAAAHTGTSLIQVHKPSDWPLPGILTWSHRPGPCVVC